MNEVSSSNGSSSSDDHVHRLSLCQNNGEEIKDDTPGVTSEEMLINTDEDCIQGAVFDLSCGAGAIANEREIESVVSCSEI